MRRRLAIALPLAVYLTSVAAFFVRSPHARSDFPLDDAWTHRVYARAIASGAGFAYNPGQQEAGATSPLWVLVSAPAHWLAPWGEPAVAVGVKAIGTLFGAVAVVLVYAIARRLRDSLAEGALAACVVAADPRLAFAALSGMEITLLVTLWLGTAWASLRARFLHAMILAGLMIPTRPEAGLAAAVAALGWIAAADRARPVGRRGLGLIALGLPAVLWVTFCLWVTGHPLPNTFYLKTRSFAFGGAEVRAAAASVIEHGWNSHALLVAGLALSAGCFGFRVTRERWPAALLLLVAPALVVVGVVGSREFRLDGFYWTRWTDPAALVWAAAAAIGFARLLVGGGGFALGARPQAAPLRWRMGALAAASLGVVALAYGAIDLTDNWRERRERLTADGHAIRRVNVDAGEWVRAHTPPDAVIGVNDAGAIRYFGERRTIDLLGLNDSEIAFRRVDPQAVVDSLDWLAVFPSWFEGLPWVRGFEPRASFGVDVAEYTPCDCPAQARNVVAERR